MLYITCGFLPTSIAKVINFSQSMLIREYISSFINVIRDTALWIFFVSSRNYCTENIGKNVIVDPELLNLETFVISSEPTVDARRG